MTEQGLTVQENSLGCCGNTKDLKNFRVLDRLENHSRQRIRLVPNRYGTSHSDAALVNQISASSENLKNNDNGNDHSNVQKSIPKVPGIHRCQHQGCYKVINCSDFSSRTVSHGFSEDSMLFEGSSLPDKELYLSKTYSVLSDLDDQILFKASIEVIKPFISTSGDLTLTHSVLIFEPSEAFQESPHPEEGAGVIEDSNWDKKSNQGGCNPLSEECQVEDCSEKQNCSNDKVEGSYRWALRGSEAFELQLKDLVRASPRSHLHQMIGVELFFFAPTAPVLLRFESHSRLVRFLDVLSRCRDWRFRFLNTPWKEFGYWKSPAYFELKASFNENLLDEPPRIGELPVTRAWLERKISNFDYLMELNTAAGRGYNDLSQHPIFPWVVADWSSDKLDLDQPETFRDLDWPIGAQNKEQRREAKQRFEDLNTMNQELLIAKKKLKHEHYEEESPLMCAPALPPFHHGSHYSTAGFVIWYMMRVEPYTSLHIHLQDGRFDKPDRLFSSLPASYKNAVKNHSDNKEAIPELYCLPEMLCNQLRLPLGLKQDGSKVDNVELPPWANGDPWKFIRLHREALESEYVSSKLHRWIDLIFGYKQRGIQGVRALNVFYHLTYSGMVDLELLKKSDPLLYQSTLLQMEEFGQTPPQIFKKPHPQRRPLRDVVWPLASQVLGSKSSRPPLLFYPPGLISKVTQRDKLVALFAIPAKEMMISVTKLGTFGVHLFKVFPPEAKPPFKFRSRASRKSLLAPLSLTDKLGKIRLDLKGGEFHIGSNSDAQSENLLHENWLYAFDYSTCLFISAARKDGTLQVYNVKNASVLVSLIHRSGLRPVTNVQLDEGSSKSIQRPYRGRLVTAASDCSVVIWSWNRVSLGKKNYAENLNIQPLYILELGDYCNFHSGPCMALSVRSDALILSMKPLKIELWSLQSSIFLLQLDVNNDLERLDIRKGTSTTLAWVGFSGGIIVAYVRSVEDSIKGVLITYTTNGHFLAHLLVNDAIGAFLFSEDGTVLIFGDASGRISMHHLHDLSPLYRAQDSRFLHESGNSSSRDPISCLALSSGEGILMVGTSGGKAGAVTILADYLRQRLRQELEILGL